MATHKLKEVLRAAFKAGKESRSEDIPQPGDHTLDLVKNPPGFGTWYANQPTGYYATTEYMFYRMLLYWKIFRSATGEDHKTRYFEGYTIFKDLYLDAGGDREKTEFNYLNTLLNVDVFEHL